MPAQSECRFEFQLPEGPTFEVVRFELTEALSAPFRLELELSSAQSSVDLDALLDGPAVFALTRAGHTVREVHGIVTAFQQGESGFRRTRYRAVVEPPLVRLDLRRNSRIFQRKAVPTILKTLLDEQQVQGAFRTARDHLEREYCVQHREQDLEFFQRLAGEEGLVYYFDAAGQSKLALTDALPAGPRMPGQGEDTGTVVYQPNPGGDAAAPRLWRFAYGRQLASTHATQRDYTFKNPRYDLEHRSQARDSVGDYEHYDVPGRYKQDEAGKPFTLTRLNALRREASYAELEGDDARLWPGLAFALSDHPTDSLNRDWRVVAMVHQGEQSSGQEEESFGAEQGSRYRYTGKVVPADTDWKPAPCPRPVMDGLQVAHVVGPPGEEIHTDEHGRVMVWFPWDREGPREDSTCWIRVSQGWAGASYGVQMLPRIGHEVLVSFLDGDPDQPIVTGRSYHASNRPPYALSGLKTLTTIKSQEHKGGGHNELLIDDTSGQIKAQLKSTHAATQLNLGYLTHPRNSDGTGTPRGEGFELRTDASGALRAARGLLLTAYERAGAGGGQLDHSELVACMNTLADLVKSLTDTAAEHQGLPLKHSPRDALVKAVEQLGAGANDRKEEDGSKPVVAVNAPEGIAMLTPRSVFLGASENVELSAQGNQSLTAAQRLHLTAGDGISVFAVQGGIHQIAHRDHLRLQAQHGEVQVEALDAVRVSATDGQIVLNAGKRLTLMCGGAYLTLEGGNIELGCPGTLTVKAKTEISGSASLSEAMNTWGDAEFDDAFVLLDEVSGEPLRDTLIEMTRSDGAILQVRTDAQGRLPEQRAGWTDLVKLRPMRSPDAKQGG